MAAASNCCRRRPTNAPAPPAIPVTEPFHLRNAWPARTGPGRRVRDAPEPRTEYASAPVQPSRRDATLAAVVVDFAVAIHRVERDADVSNQVLYDSVSGELQVIIST